VGISTDQEASVLGLHYSEYPTHNESTLAKGGMLHFLPFQMLGEQLPNGKFDFLIEHYSLFYAHSLDMLYQQRDRIANISILAMANADQTLPAAEQEVNDLKAMYPDTQVFIHEAASEDKAKASTGKHNILHFATHGNLDYFDYSKSYLTLAPNKDGSEDGKLTIEEVWEIEDIYSYQMVTLSACKTAVTEDFNNGWAVSPATSFIDAGVPTVVASLQAVNDESTSLLMKYFYRNLSSMSKVEALCRAQIELSQNAKFSHPYYWSPFILIGDWR
jgi:CHAT domain-containing protein